MNIELQQQVAKGQEDWAFSIGVQAFIWGYPIVECWKDRLKKSIPADILATNDKPTTNTINKFRHVRSLSSYKSSEFVNSATDFLYSTAVIDLRSGPVMLTAPNFQNRWYGIQILDAYMETLANLGTRTFGSQLPPTIITNDTNICADKFADNVTVVHCDINFIYIVVRIATNPKENITQVHALQDSIVLKNLKVAESSRTIEINPITYGFNNNLPDPSSSSCPKELEFFNELGSVINFVPPKADEAMLLALLSEIGITPEKGFSYGNLPPGVISGLTKAIPFAESILERKLYEVGKNINGWGLLLDIGRYDKNYIIRALVAKHGIWANIPEESMYFIARTDNQGGILHGNNNYEIKFPHGQTPPVDAFWSISYYDAAGCIVKESGGKNAINSLYDELHYDCDGSISIVISQNPPEDSQSKNWLPSHNGMFSLNLRCYNPKKELLELYYEVPPIILVTSENNRQFSLENTIGDHNE